MLALILAAPHPVRAIYGGKRATAGQGDAAALITWRRGADSGRCSGTLITPLLVLTAGHCARSPKGQDNTIRSVRIGDPAVRATKVRVASVHVHPQYDAAAPERGQDLALLVLAAPVADHLPIAVGGPEDHPEKQGTRLGVLGFGMTLNARGRAVPTTTLNAASLEALSPFHCFHGPVQEMARTRLCAASPTAGVCPGDSGAGVTRQVEGREVLVGVVSVSIEARACHHGAVVMARATAFGDWLADVAAEASGAVGR